MQLSYSTRVAWLLYNEEKTWTIQILDIKYIDINAVRIIKPAGGQDNWPEHDLSHYMITCNLNWKFEDTDANAEAKELTLEANTKF